MRLTFEGSPKTRNSTFSPRVHSVDPSAMSHFKSARFESSRHGSHHDSECTDDESSDYETDRCIRFLRNQSTAFKSRSARHSCSSDSSAESRVFTIRHEDVQAACDLLSPSAVALDRRIRACKRTPPSYPSFCAPHVLTSISPGSRLYDIVREAASALLHSPSKPTIYLSRPGKSPANSTLYLCRSSSSRSSASRSSGSRSSSTRSTASSRSSVSHSPKLHPSSPRPPPPPSHSRLARSRRYGDDKRNGDDSDSDNDSGILPPPNRGRLPNQPLPSNPQTTRSASRPSPLPNHPPASRRLSHPLPAFTSPPTAGPRSRSRAPPHSRNRSEGYLGARADHTEGAPRGAPRVRHESNSGMRRERMEGDLLSGAPSSPSRGRGRSNSDTRRRDLQSVPFEPRVRSPLATDTEGPEPVAAVEDIPRRAPSQHSRGRSTRPAGTARRPSRPESPVLRRVESYDRSRERSAARHAAARNPAARDEESVTRSRERASAAAAAGPGVAPMEMRNRGRSEGSTAGRAARAGREAEVRMRSEGAEARAGLRARGPSVGRSGAEDPAHLRWREPRRRDALNGGKGVY